jgi:hypothetical protein
VVGELVGGCVCVGGLVLPILRDCLVQHRKKIQEEKKTWLRQKSNNLELKKREKLVI